MDQKIFTTYESEVRSYCRKFPTVFTKAKNATLTDEDGRDYIDFFCGAGACNYGHNNDYIKDRVIQYLQDDGIVHAMDMYSAAKGDFIKFFETKVLQPRGLNYKIMFPGPTGTNAMESALKLARKVTGRTNIFCLMGCFHGMTMGSLALTTDVTARGGAGVPLHDVTHIPAPYMFPDFDTIDYMETLLTDDHSGVEKPAALVVEAVQAEGGVYPLPDEWLQRARALCDHYGILMILDEIQVGNCRTGTFFAFEHAGIKPDMVTMAKSIGGMGMPFALTLFRPELDVWTPGEHNGTFRGFQLATVAGKAGLEYMLDHQIPAEVCRKGAIVDQYLTENLPKVSSRLTHRGRGLIWGIDFSAFPEGVAKAVSAECFKRALVIELAGRGDCVLKPMPPLTISDDDLIRGLNIIMESIRALDLQ
ncbi:MAG: aspartate aminotransferase family protein [Oscillibacter sp.]|jgi:diaminobutyrate-2-oxoglutarate transaminase|nr:aspartate aminotransferase family protein [Oscillibacter sp.]